MKTQQELDSERIAAAIEFLILHRTSHTGLGDVADHVHLSPCPVSYTHLDVYKRQATCVAARCSPSTR